MKQIRRRKWTKKISVMTIILPILAVFLLGDIIGAVLYVRQEAAVQAQLYYYLQTGESLSFFQIFWQQFLYQLTIWSLGLLVVGNFVNIFLIFMHGIRTGFNLAILTQTATAGVIVLWLVQMILIIFTTILSMYFSIRFAYLVIKSIINKKYKRLKHHLIIYGQQFAVIFLLTILTALTSAIIMPFVLRQMF